MTSLSLFYPSPQLALIQKVDVKGTVDGHAFMINTSILDLCQRFLERRGEKPAPWKCKTFRFPSTWDMRHILRPQSWRSGALRQPEFSQGKSPIHSSAETKSEWPVEHFSHVSPRFEPSVVWFAAAHILISISASMAVQYLHMLHQSLSLHPPRQYLSPGEAAGLKAADHPCVLCRISLSTLFRQGCLKWRRWESRAEYVTTHFIFDTGISFCGSGAIITV